MFKLLSRSLEKVTPEKAKEYLENYNKWEGQKPLRDWWVKTLIGRFTVGLFTTGDIAFACYKDNKLLVNGQHTCTMAVEGGITFPAVVETYDCEERIDIAHLYAQFDANSPRSDRNVMMASRPFLSPDLRHINLMILSVCGTALLYLGGGTRPSFGKKALAKSDKVDLVKKYKNDVIVTSRYWSDTKLGNKRLTVGLATAIIATFRAYPNKAAEFWDRVIFGDELKRGSPQYNLNKALGSIKEVVHKSIGFGAGFQRAIYSLCVAWFNSFIKNDGRKAVKLGAMDKIPNIVISKG